MVSVPREYVLYGVALLVGAVAVPVLAYLEVGAFVAAHVLELVFLGALAVIGVVFWFLRSDLPRRSVWVVVEIVLIVLLVPVAVGSGALLYGEYTGWKGDGVHWHADFQVVVDGQAYDLKDPDVSCGNRYLCSLINHTGSMNVHEHGDQRIHIHSPVEQRSDATLGGFFDAFGGTLTNTDLRYPTNDGWIDRENTDESTVKVLVRQQRNGTATWTHLPEPASYVISPRTHSGTDSLFIVYDNLSVAEALQDVRTDDRYRGVTVDGSQ